jgi:orotidine-5'-phosphate decarboxylase
LNFDAHPRSSLIVALDFDSLNTALKFAKQVADLVGMFKIGSQLFTAAGPAAVKEISALGPGIFLDLKFHDIPNTVAGAVLSSAAMTGVQLVNVHALGGTAMLHAAAQAISAGVPMGADRPRLIAVTVLTSMDAKAIREVGIGGPPKTRVVKLAKLAKSAGVDGVVASVQEARAIRKACGRDFLIDPPQNPRVPPPTARRNPITLLSSKPPRRSPTTKPAPPLPPKPSKPAPTSS